MMKNQLTEKHKEAQAILNYNIMLNNCSVYMDKNISNYNDIIKSLKYLSKKSCFDNATIKSLFRDCTALYISKLIENEITDNITNYLEKSIRGIFK